MNGTSSSQVVDGESGQLKSTFIALFSVISALSVLYAYLSSSASDEASKFYEVQPCPGRKQQWFSWLRATLKSFSDSPAMVDEGYHKFSKSNAPFVVPNITKGPVVIIPPAQLKTILSKPESEIAAQQPQREHIQATYTVKDENLFPNNYKVDLVRRSLTKNFALLTKEVAEEIALAFDDYWGTSTEWTSIVAWDTLQKVSARASNRAFLGLPLCRDEKFIDYTRRYSMSLIENGTFINMFPKVLRPVFGPLIALGGQREFKKCLTMVIPLLERRLQDIQRKKDDPSFDWEPPCDGIQWVIEESRASQDPQQLEPSRMAHRLLILNFNSVHPISLVLANTIVDLYSSSPDEGFVDALRRECDQVLAQSQGEWTKDAIGQLVCLDSAIRESMRISDFSSFMLPRQVSAPNGVLLADNTRLPRGVRLAVPMHNIHHDESFYPSASHFDPFRFCGSTNIPNYNSNGALDSNTHNNMEPEARKAKSMVTLDDTFLMFGYGKNGCPGRFFAAHQMKLAIAHALQYYDVEYMSERPKLNTTMEFRFPDEKMRIKVRRRKVE